MTTDEKKDSNVSTAIILDATYIFLALYNKLEGQWQKKTTKAKHKNNYFDGYEFINYYFENIPMHISDLIATTKMQYISGEKKTADIYITKGAKTSWRNNVVTNYKSELSNKMIPIIEIIIRKEIGISDCKLCHGFNLESNDCIALLIQKIRDKNKDMMVHIISNNKRLIQLSDERTSITNMNNEPLPTKSILPTYSFFTPNKFLFFLILKGDTDTNIDTVFFDEKSDSEYEQYYENNELITAECQDILLAERLRNNYLMCDYNSIPKKLKISFYKNNIDI